MRKSRTSYSRSCRRGVLYAMHLMKFAVGLQEGLANNR